MKKAMIVLAVLISASTVNALEVELGSVKFKNAMVPMLKEYLATQAETETVGDILNTYASTNGTYTLTNQVVVGVEPLHTTTHYRVVEIPEGEVARMRRLCRTGGIPAFKSGFKDYHDKKAIAAIPETEDPEETE